MYRTWSLVINEYVSKRPQTEPCSPDTQQETCSCAYTHACTNIQVRSRLRLRPSRQVWAHAHAHAHKHAHTHAHAEIQTYAATCTFSITVKPHSHPEHMHTCIHLQLYAYVCTSASRSGGSISSVAVTVRWDPSAVPPVCAAAPPALSVIVDPFRVPEDFDYHNNRYTYMIHRSVYIEMSWATDWW